MLGEFFFVSKLSDDCLSVSYMTERERERSACVFCPC